MTGGPVPLPRSPLSLAPAVRGAWSIDHSEIPEGRVDVVSPRAALFAGRPPTWAVLERPLTITQLHGPMGLVMSDVPEELEAMQRLANRAFGHVLVGGLGLGVLVHYLAERGKRGGPVRSVTIVEQSQDVADLVVSSLPRQLRLEVLIVDVARFIERLPIWTYDVALLDTWSGTGEQTWCDDVVRLRRLIYKRFGARRVECWAEDVMRGQVLLTLASATASVRAGGTGPGRLPAAAFLAGVSRCKPGSYTWEQRAQVFVRGPGTYEWERLFGRAWDAAKETP